MINYLSNQTYVYFRGAYIFTGKILQVYKTSEKNGLKPLLQNYLKIFWDAPVKSLFLLCLDNAFLLT